MYIEDIESIETKFYMDYETTKDFYDQIGIINFLDFLDNSFVIALDEKTYYFIYELKSKYRDNQNQQTKD